MKKVIVLGAGLVGGPISKDLAKDENFLVTVADIDTDKLAKLSGIERVKTIHQDLSDFMHLGLLLEKFDFVVNAVPGSLGYKVMQAIIESGMNGVDISFMPEQFWLADGMAKERGVCLIPDMGVAPGLSNLLVGYGCSLLDEALRAKIYVGGLPKVRSLPYQYKAVFSPSDVIEEYTRPAMIVENGEKVYKEPLTEPENLEFEGVGTLEAFNSDGLRSLAYSMNVPWMIEKTLRYPGHRELMEVFKTSGFFSTEKINIKGTEIAPRDMTSKLLFKEWKLEAGEEDITVMRVEVEGIKDGREKKYCFELYDEYDHDTTVHSMAMTTGYSATMALRLLASGKIDKKGIILPEYLGQDHEWVEFILTGLEERGIYIKKMVR